LSIFLRRSDFPPWVRGKDGKEEIVRELLRRKFLNERSEEQGERNKETHLNS